MKAAVLYAPGDLRFEETPFPEPPKKGEVIIKVMAAGICGSDLNRVMHTGTYHFPCIPGHEFCGVVQEVGPDTDSVHIGDRVAVAPIIPCNNCEPCQRGDFGLCENYNYIGSRCDGAFAEYVKAPAKNLVPMPDNVNATEGAAVEPAAVALHGIMRIGIKAGDVAVIFGCGTIGLFAMQFVKIMGASKIIAIDVDDTKLEQAKAAGADETINSISSDPIESIAGLTGGKLADVSIETAGVCITQEQCIRAVKKGGRVLYLGTAHKDVVLPPETFEKIIRGELMIKGSWNSFSSPFPGREWHTVLDYLSDGRFKIRPFISHVVSLEELPKTIAAMDGHEFSFTKIIVGIDI